MTSIKRKENRAKILNYAREIYKNEQRFISKREIRKKFHLEIYNYFENMFDLYQHLGVDVPLCYCPREYAKKKIIVFVRERSEKGLYPTKVEIEREWKIQIYTYFKNIEDIYIHANIDFELYLNRTRQIENPFHSPTKLEENSNKILQYIRNQNKLGFYPSTNKIQEELNLAFYKYFNDIYEAYAKAGVEYYRVSLL